MQVTYELQVTDWQAADRFFAARRAPRDLAPRNLLRWAFWVLLVGSPIAVPLVAIPLQYVQTPAFTAAWKVRGVAALSPVAFVLIPISCLALLWFGAPLLRGHAFRQSPSYGRRLTLSIEPDGLRGQDHTPWSQIHRVEETSAHVFIVFGDNRVFIIPKRAFESDFTATQFAAKCRDGRSSYEKAENRTSIAFPDKN